MGKKKRPNKINNEIDKSKKIVVKKVSTLNSNLKTIKPSMNISNNILQELKYENNQYKAMDILVDKTPFGKMALSAYTSLTNPDGEFTFVNPKTGKRIKRIEEEWKVFQKRRWANNDAGLDGLFDTLARSNYTRGEMAIEIIISKDARDIEAILIIDPSTYKDFVWLESENRYAIYQNRDDNKSVDLYEGNFYRFPYQPNLNNPLGTLPFLPAIQATIESMEHEESSKVIAYKAGSPRMVVSINGEAVLAQATPSERQTAKERNAILENAVEMTANQMAGLERNSDIITFDSNKIDILGGNNTSIDLRAWSEIYNVNICNAYSLPKIYLNLEQGGSYALGSAEQEALVIRLDNSRDNLSSIKEIIGNFYCRVKGYNAVSKFIPVPLEWQNLEEKWKAELKRLEFYRRQEEYGYYDIHTVANIMTGNSKAENMDNVDKFEYISASGGSSENKIEETTEKEEGDVTVGKNIQQD